MKEQKKVKSNPKPLKPKIIQKKNKTTYDLQKDGVVVVDILNSNQLKEISNILNDSIHSFREYKSTNTNIFVMGGFAGLGNPSSFHNPFVRKMRREIHPIAKRIISNSFVDIIQEKKYKFAQEICRMLIRDKGLKPTPESWHRDVSPNPTDEDEIVFGGWLNLDTKSQYFSCILGTQKYDKTKEGFVMTKDKALIKKYNNQKTIIEIPAGALMIFNEKLIHEVLAKAASFVQHRLHMAWRLTTGTQPAISNLLDLLDKQAVIPLKSGQIPPMYAKLHWTNWRQKIEIFSENIRPECLVTRTVQSGKDKGKKYKIVAEHMNSLDYYKFQKYKDYEREEIDILIPQIL